MFPLLPAESLGVALEIVCYLFTIMGALLSFLVTGRC